MPLVPHEECSQSVPFRFHCGQTITLSVLLGVATTFLTWRPYLVRTSDEVARESIHAAAFTGSIYWIAGMAAILYPGTMGLDPEFGGPGFPQAWIFVASAALGLGGAWLESRRQGKAMTKQA